jgi:hypothetical protein
MSAIILLRNSVIEVFLLRACRDVCLGPSKEIRSIASHRETRRYYGEAVPSNGDLTLAVFEWQPRWFSNLVRDNRNGTPDVAGNVCMANLPFVATQQYGRW